MRGLDQRIHAVPSGTVFPARRDGRVKPGHDANHTPQVLPTYPGYLHKVTPVVGSVWQNTF
jgi:hypothetical protein